MLPISSPTARSTAVRLTVAVTALVAAAVGTIALPGAAHADDTTTTVAAQVAAPSTISIRATRARIQPGGTGRVTGNLQITGPTTEGGREVTLEARPSGESDFTPIGVAISGELGGLRLEVTPEVTTRYRWRYDGAGDAVAQTSGVVGVTVAERSGGRPTRLATSLSVRATDRPGPADDIVRGKLRTGRLALAGRVVVLLSRAPDRSDWSFAASARTNRHGLARFGVTPSSSTTYRIRFLGSQIFRPTASGVVRVAPAATVTIAASPLALDPGATTTISGSVTAGGQPLVGATVVLLARQQGNDHFRPAGSGATGADGSVAIPATPARDTAYRLLVPASATTAATTSDRVRVSVLATSSLSIRERTRDDRVRITGTLRSSGRPVRGALVSLVAQAPGETGWTVVGAGRTSRSGAVGFVRAVVADTSYRLEFAGNGRIAAAASGVVVD